MSCFDEDLISNDRIGDNLLKFPDIVTGDGEYVKKWYPILYKKKKSGEVFLECRLVADHEKKPNIIRSKATEAYQTLEDSMMEEIDEGTRNKQYKQGVTDTAGQGDILGTLTLKIIRGKLKRNTEAVGKMDPFVVISYLKQKYETSIIKDGGQLPTWN